MRFHLPSKPCFPVRFEHDEEMFLLPHMLVVVLCRSGHPVSRHVPEDRVDLQSPLMPDGAPVVFATSGHFVAVENVTGGDKVDLPLVDDEHPGVTQVESVNQIPEVAWLWCV